MRRKVPLTLVTGFLGSGKTTLLTHLVRRMTGGPESRKVLCIVNEFAETDVDGARLIEDVTEDFAVPVMTIPGGSIFCECLAGKFIETLGQVHSTVVAQDIDGLLVEASGMADPRVVDKLLMDAKLDDRFELKQVVTVLDPMTFFKLRRTMPVVERQLRSADVVLINKIDRVSPIQIEATARDVYAINPDVPVLTCQHAIVDLDPFTDPTDLTGPARRSDGRLAPCKDFRFDRKVLPFGPVLDKDEVAEFIETNRQALLRVKGYFRGMDGRSYELDDDGHELQIVSVDSVPDEAGLVMICHRAFTPQVGMGMRLLLSPKMAYA